jgi:hypothetical protein
VGRRRIEHQALHIDTFNVARLRAARRIEIRANRFETVQMTMKQTTRANMMQMLHRNIGDRVTLVYTPMGLNASIHLERRVLEVSDGGKVVETTWDGIKTDAASWGATTLGTYKWGPGADPAFWSGARADP